MPQLGKAYIEVHADLSKFPAELRRDLKKAFAEGVAGVELDGLVDKAEKAGEEAGKKAGKGFEKTAKNEFKKGAEAAGKEAGRGLLGGIRAIFGRGGGGGAKGGLGGIVRGLFGGVKDAVGQGLQSLQSAGSQVTGALGSLVSGGGDVVGAIKIAAIIAAIPAVFALAGALVHLSSALLLIPSAAGFAAAAIAPLVIGFQGFGKALSAGFSGDVEKFNEALKNLAPSARAVVKEITAFKAPFSQLRRDVQQALFSELVGQIKPFLKEILPVLSRGLVAVAGALSEFLAKFVELLHANDILKDLGKLFGSTAGIIRGLTPSIINLLGTLFGVMEHGLPFLEKAFGAVGRGIQKFADFLSNAMKSGDFDRWLNNAAGIAKELIGILGEVGHLIGAIFGGQNVAEGSTKFLDDVKKAIKSLADFFESDEGKQVIDGWLTTVKGLGVAIIALAIFIGKAAYWSDQFVRGIAAAVGWIGKLLQAIGGGFVTGLKAIGSFFADLGTSIAGFFVDLYHTVIDFFTKDVPDAGNSLVDFFQSLPGRIFDFVKQAFLDFVSFVAEQIGHFVGLILAAPYLLAQVPSLIGALFEQIGQFFIDLYNKAVEWGTAVVQFFIDLPGKIGSALSSLAATIGGWFVSIFNDARTFVQNGINDISNFIGSLPGRIRALGPALLDAARSLGRKIGDGFSEIGNFASDIGHKIVSAIKSGINYIVDGINRGIADIDDKIPIGLPRLPHFERGGVVDSPTVALLGEKGKREVVLPLTDPARAQQLAEQSGLSKILARGAASPTVNLTAYLDGYGFIKVIRMVAGDMLDEQGAELAYGART